MTLANLFQEVGQVERFPKSKILKIGLALISHCFMSITMAMDIERKIGMTFGMS